MATSGEGASVEKSGGPAVGKEGGGRREGGGGDCSAAGARGRMFVDGAPANADNIWCVRYLINRQSAGAAFRLCFDCLLRP